MRMDLPDLGRMITPTVMALGEERDRIDGRILQGFLSALLVELRSNARNVRRGVEVEMDLAIAEWMFCLFHEIFLFAVPAAVMPLGRRSSTAHVSPLRFQDE